MKNFILQTVVLINIFVFEIVSCNAAYLIYFDKEEELSFETQKKIYKTIDELSWPNNLNVWKEKNIIDLPQYMLSKQPGAECHYIEKQLQNDHKNLHLLWVPSTIFQIAAFLDSEMWVHDEDNIIKGKTGLIEDEAVRRYFIVNNSLLKLFMQNNYIECLSNAIKLKEWDKYGSYLGGFYKAIIKVYDNNSRVYDQHKYSLSLVGEDIFKEIFKIEFMAYAHNEFPLFRSSTPIQYKDQKSSFKEALDSVIVGSEVGGKIQIFPQNPEKAFGISLANTFIAGAIDINACALYILSGELGRIRSGKHNLFSININKKEYIEKYMDIIYWPQSNPITDLFKDGERFHPRSAGNESCSWGAYNNYKPKKFIFANDQSQYKELEIWYLMSQLLNDYMKLIHDGHSIINHQIDEKEHPNNELYSNQLELGNLISNRCLEIWNEFKPK